jgi:hypothetical protein
VRRRVSVILSAFGVGVFVSPEDCAPRELVALLSMMQEHMLANMRDDLLAIAQIQDGLADHRFDAAAEIAEGRLGMSSHASYGAARVQNRSCGSMPCWGCCLTRKDCAPASSARTEGRRLELMASGKWPMHRPQPLPCASREDSNWEPDGVTHLVRFYEGSGTYRCADTILWHRRANRRQTENTNCVLVRREIPTYSPNPHAAFCGSRRRVTASGDPVAAG